MTTPASAPGRPRYFAFLPAFLFSADEPKVRYVAKAWLLALVPSLVLAALINLVAPDTETPDFPVAGPLFVALVVVVAPLLETLLMIPPLWVLNRFAGPGPAAIGSAILWGAVHSLSAPAWGLVTWWPFLILSIAFLTWRRRGIGTAILIVTSIHALQNGVAASLPLLLGMTG